MKFVSLLILFLVFLSSCRKDKVGFQATPYNLEIPSHFPKMNIPSDNPLTVEGVELAPSIGATGGALTPAKTELAAPARRRSSGSVANRTLPSVLFTRLTSMTPCVVTVLPSRWRSTQEKR
jgi:hypothetical protein